MPKGDDDVQPYWLSAKEQETPDSCQGHAFCRAPDATNHGHIKRANAIQPRETLKLKIELSLFPERYVMDLSSGINVELQGESLGNPEHMLNKEPSKLIR